MPVGRYWRKVGWVGSFESKTFESLLFKWRPSLRYKMGQIVIFACLWFLRTPSIKFQLNRELFFNHLFALDTSCEQNQAVIFADISNYPSFFARHWANRRAPFISLGCDFLVCSHSFFFVFSFKTHRTEVKRSICSSKQHGNHRCEQHTEPKEKQHRKGMQDVCTRTNKKQ